MTEQHETKEVDSKIKKLQALGEKLRPTMPFKVTVARVADDTPFDSEGGMVKKVHFIRHGQGFHNVAQAEWRAAGKPGEPYTLDTDPDFGYGDALLTPVGEQQARDLQARTATVDPQVLIVSPMRRAMQTGLLAFEPHVNGKREAPSSWTEGNKMPVVAIESAHEIAGKHTCDKRESKSNLAASYPLVNFGLVESEEDPFWGDGTERESLDSLAQRGAGFIGFLKAREETHIAVAAHSTILLTLMNAVLLTSPDAPEDANWFGTGELRTFLLRWESQ